MGAVTRVGSMITIKTKKACYEVFEKILFCLLDPSILFHQIISNGSRCVAILKWV